MLNFKFCRKLSLFLLLIMFVMFIQSSVSFASKSENNVNLKIGDYIQFGRYQGEHILWRVIDIDDEGDPLLLADEIITL